MWCGDYYCAASDESFPLIKAQEEEGFDLTQARDKQMHLRTRYGDHHNFVPFQFDLYHFRNLTNRYPAKSAADVKSVVSIRKANL